MSDDDQKDPFLDDGSDDAELPKDDAEEPAEIEDPADDDLDMWNPEE